MKHIAIILRRFRQNQRGATLVEFSLSLAIFLLLFFGLIDYGRLAYHHITAEKALHIAARVAAVRPPACPGLPEFNTRGTTTLTPLPRFGTGCGAGTNFCAVPVAATCVGSAGNATASEIWGLVGAGLPPGTTVENLEFSYAFDPNLGFLGGPYVPVVTVAIVDADFSFVSPLGQLVGLAGGTAPQGLGGDINFPEMSVSLPAEDLASGTNG